MRALVLAASISLAVLGSSRAEAGTLFMVQQDPGTGSDVLLSYEAGVLSTVGPIGFGDARGLAYRLYSICERKGWAGHARDYNALVVSWSASQEQAAAFKEQYQQGRLFED